MGEGVRVAVNARVARAPLTGLQRYLLELLRRWGDRVRVLAPEKGNLPRTWGHLWEQFVLPRHLRGELLFSPANSSPLSVAKQVVTVHDIAPLDFPEGVNPVSVSFYRFTLPRLVHRVRGIITVSEFTRERLVERLRVSPSHVRVIPNGVDPRFSVQEKESVARALEALGIPSPHYVLGVGLMSPRKNLPRLLEAWERVQLEVPEEVWLVLVGGEKEKGLKSVGIERAVPRVYLTGRVPDELLPALYSGALALAYPSLYEGFGLPPLEAMACGTPVLASNTTSIPEVVGESALLVDPLDVEAIAHGLKRLIEDPSLRETLRAKGLERAKGFSWQRTAELTWATLEEMAEGN